MKGEARVRAKADLSGLGLSQGPAVAFNIPEVADGVTFGSESAPPGSGRFPWGMLALLVFGAGLFVALSRKRQG